MPAKGKYAFFAFPTCRLDYRSDITEFKDFCIEGHILT